MKRPLIGLMSLIATGLALTSTTEPGQPPQRWRLKRKPTAIPDGNGIQLKANDESYIKPILTKEMLASTQMMLSAGITKLRPQVALA